MSAMGELISTFSNTPCPARHVLPHHPTTVRFRADPVSRGNRSKYGRSSELTVPALPSASPWRPGALRQIPFHLRGPESLPRRPVTGKLACFGGDGRWRVEHRRKKGVQVLSLTLDRTEFEAYPVLVAQRTDAKGQDDFIRGFRSGSPPYPFPPKFQSLGVVGSGHPATPSSAPNFMKLFSILVPCSA